MWPICVLLWMRFVVRKRFYLQTLFDYIQPLLFGGGALLIMTLTSSDDSKVANALEVGEGAERGMHVLFTPDTNSTRQLMARVGAKLGLRPLDHLPSWNESGYFSFSNVTPYSMLEYSKGMSPTDAIVIFENMQSDVLPLKLDYAIRVKTYDEQYLFPMLKLDTDFYEQQDTDYESFTRLQWAIDTSYLQMLTGSDLGQILTLQALPYAKPNKAALKIMHLSLVAPFSFFPVFGNLNTRLSEEKNSGMHELIKIAGVSAGTINFSHILNFVPHLVIWLTIFVIYCEVSNITATSTFFEATASVLYYFTIVAASFLFTHALNLNKNVNEISTLLILALLIGAFFMVYYITNMTLLIFCCLVPNVPLYIFWTLVAAREFFGDKVTISNMWSLDERVWILPSMPLSVGGTFVAMLLQIILYFTLGWYLSLVHPGKHGQALPWNFVCRKEYWSKTPKVVEEEERLVSGVDPLYFEKPPVGLPVGIQMSKVSKTFGRDVVLQGVTASVYKGEITVLLGHNGAGKTTLISIITGFISATSGRVLVEGLDTRTQAQQVRRRVGQCPQHDVLFTQLSVLEHVMFFAMIRGQTYAESKASAMQLLKKLDLESKAEGLTTVLSGGMKRRTQLACALAGNASVLLLDEPTSGLDVQTRRDLWNLLLNLRGEHTVLLTTHYMEEADALGDRVMALRRGVVQCHGTPMFLKRAIGSGYRLSLTTTDAPREPALTAVIQRVVPEAAVLDRQQRHISYRLPSDTSKFPELFAALEETRADLGINTIGVGRSSLDEVFVQLCSDEKPTLAEESDTKIAEPELVKASGAALHARRFKVLLQRQARYLKSQMRGTILFSLLILVGLGVLTHFTNNNSMKQSDEPLNSGVDLNLKMYASRARTRALVNINDEFALATLRTANSKVDFEEVPDIAKAFLRTGGQSIQDFKDYIVGIELNSTTAKALYSPRVRLAAPVAVNLLSNALAAWLLADADGRTVCARSRPLRGPFLPYDYAALDMPKEQSKIRSWATYGIFLMALSLSSFLMLPHSERVSLTRHSLLMTGCPIPLYWAATYAAMLVRVVLFCIIPIVVFTYALEKDHTINRPGFTVVMCPLLVAGSAALLAQGCFMTTLPMKQMTLMGIIMIMTYIFGLGTPQLQLKMTDTSESFHKLIYIPYVLMPLHTLAVGLAKAGLLAGANAFCNLNRDKCPVLDNPKPFDTKKCCDSPVNSEPFGYWGMGDEEPTKEILIHVGQFIVYTVLTMCSDLGVWSRLHVLLRERGGVMPAARCDDAAARAEATYVGTVIKLPKTEIQDAILCHQLVKKFSECLKQPLLAVKRVSFSVKKGECFGLVGVNGAGKSTIFKMVTRESCPSGGAIFAHGHQLADRSAYMKTLSYCPQFSSLDTFLTGRQNLELVLVMRGLSDADAGAVADTWIAEVGLEQHAHKVLSSYSGGMGRRLAAAAALCQRARTALLDEATAGVDPVARRRLHRAVKRASRTSSLIVTSHSLDEIETLCHRIGIMSAGELCALGTVAALKAQHAAGYSVVFKLITTQLGPDDDDTTLKEFKAKVESEFNCSLKDEHLTTLSYHIKDRLAYSKLFVILEQLKQQYPGLVEDYSVTETTLEEVFLALAKKAQANDSSPAGAVDTAPSTKKKSTK